MRILSKEFVDTPIEHLNKAFQLTDSQPTDSQLKLLFRTSSSLDAVTADEMDQIWEQLDFDCSTVSLEAASGIIDKLLTIQPCVLHLITIFKLTTFVKAHIVKELASQIPKVSNEIFYWDQRYASTWSVLRFGLESVSDLVPSRLPFMAQTIRKHKSSSFRQFYKLMTNPLKPLTKKMKLHRKRLDQMKQIQAHCLGLLSYPIYLDLLPDQPISNELYSSETDLSQSVAVLYDSRTNVIERNKSLDKVRSTLKNAIEKQLTTLEIITDSLSSYSPAIQDVSVKANGQDVDSFIAESLERLKTLIMASKKVDSTFTVLYHKHQRPGFLARYWLPLSLTVYAGFKFYNIWSIESCWQELKKLTVDGLETAHLFLTQWILDPIGDIIKTIRQKDTRLALLGANSLDADLNSLERMVIDYCKDNRALFDEATLQAQVRAGDLGPVLIEYEKELKHPLRSFFGGNLTRALLIQVQKVKVDGAIAMSAIDKLISSNELNFAFLAVVPTILITYGFSSWMRSSIENRRGFSYKSRLMAIRHCIRDIERFLTIPETNENEIIGNLLCLLIQLSELIESCDLTAVQKQIFLQDMTDLQEFVLRERIHGKRGLRIIDRVWKTFPELSRV